MKWEPGRLTYYVDNVPTNTTYTANVPARPMYLMVNNVMGGWNNNSPNATTPSPSYFDVDYVRIYQTH